MNHIKVYFGFYEQNHQLGFSYVAESLSGELIGSDLSVKRSIKGVTARTLARLIAKHRKKDITNIGIYTTNPIAINYIRAIIDGSLDTRFARTIRKRNIKLILQNNPKSDTFDIVQSNAKYALHKHKYSN